MTPPPYPTRLLAELIGTFGFFFIGFSGIAASVDRPGAIAGAGVAAGFGIGLALMIFAFGHISGGHFNPAVTLGLAAGRQFPVKEIPGYWAAQVAGGLARARTPFQGARASVATALMTSRKRAVATSSSQNDWPTLPDGWFTSASTAASEYAATASPVAARPPAIWAAQ